MKKATTKRPELPLWIGIQAMLGTSISTKPMKPVQQYQFPELCSTEPAGAISVARVRCGLLRNSHLRWAIVHLYVWILAVEFRKTQRQRVSENRSRIMTSSAPRITTPFTEDSTAAEVIAGVDLTGKRAIVTGASSGIGVETARALASAGAEVTLAVRDVEAGKGVATDITSKTGNTKVFVAPLDLNSHASITAFTKAWKGPLHILVNNAGIMALPELTLTPEGWEQQFATNHLGHFELALGLHDALAAAGNARVVSVSSSGHRRSPIVFDDMHYANRKYEDFEAYGQSKTANVLFAVEGSKRWAKDGITVNACHPGVIQTNLARHMKPNPQILEYIKSLKFKNVEQGASTQVLLATSPLVEGIGGRYFQDNNEAEVVSSLGVNTTPVGVRPHALDAADAAKLWDVSLELLKQRTV